MRTRFRLRCVAVILLMSISVAAVGVKPDVVMGDELSQAGYDDTVGEREVSIDEYIQILIEEEGLTEQEALERIGPHIVNRANPQRLYAISKRKTKSLGSGYSLVCMVTVYVWRDVSTGENLEIDHVSAPYIGLEGTTINTDIDVAVDAGGTTRTKVVVEYNGQILITVSTGTSLSFGVLVSGNINSVHTYRYDCSGSFTWLLASI